MMAVAYGTFMSPGSPWAERMQTVKAFLEAEAYDGPSMIIAYSHCIAHGYDLVHGTRSAETCGSVRSLAAVPLQPELAQAGKNPFVLDSKAPTVPLEKYIYNETRSPCCGRRTPTMPSC